MTKCPVTKCPCDEMSCDEMVVTKCPVTKCPVTICPGAAAGAGKMVLSKLAWVVPIVQPNDVLKVNLYKCIAANNTIPVGFRRRQCDTFTLPQARSTVWRLAVSSAPEKATMSTGWIANRQEW